MPVRHVIFDFGGVLLRWQPGEIIDSLYEDAALRERIAQAVFRHPDWLEMDRGTLDEGTAARRFAARVGRPMEEMVALLEHTRQSLTLIPESVTLLEELARRGLALYGLSNMSAATFAHLKQRYEVWSLFRGIVISGHVKMMKPEAAIFEHLLRTHRLSVSETLFIDDSQQNVEGAALVGLRTILFRDARQCAVELAPLLG
jgi:putative hydrolase of the HAD superfamily